MRRRFLLAQSRHPLAPHEPSPQVLQPLEPYSSASASVPHPASSPLERDQTQPPEPRYSESSSSESPPQNPAAWSAPPASSPSDPPSESPQQSRPPHQSSPAKSSALHEHPSPPLAPTHSHQPFAPGPPSQTKPQAAVSALTPPPNKPQETAADPSTQIVRSSFLHNLQSNANLGGLVFVLVASRRSARWNRRLRHRNPIALVHPSTLHNPIHVLHHRDVLQRIAFDCNQVGEPPRLNRPRICRNPKQIRSIMRRRHNSVSRSHACAHHQRELMCIRARRRIRPERDLHTGLIRSAEHPLHQRRYLQRLLRARRIQLLRMQPRRLVHLIRNEQRRYQVRPMLDKQFVALRIRVGPVLNRVHAQPYRIVDRRLPMRMRRHLHAQVVRRIDHGLDLLIRHRLDLGVVANREHSARRHNLDQLCPTPPMFSNLLHRLYRSVHHTSTPGRIRPCWIDSVARIAVSSTRTQRLQRHLDARPHRPSMVDRPLQCQVRAIV